MSIQSEINRIAGAKSDIADAIEDKGVTVPSGTKLDGMANLIGQISGGSGKLNSTQAADAYDPTATYAVGDKVSYAGNVYSCISAISTPEAWDSTHWDQVDPIQDQVDDVRNTLNNKADQSDLASLNLTGTTNTTGSKIDAGTYFYLNGSLVKALLDIADGATFTSGTNYETVTAGGLNDLSNKEERLASSSDVHYIKMGNIVIASFNVLEADGIRVQGGSYAYVDYIPSDLLPYNSYPVLGLAANSIGTVMGLVGIQVSDGRIFIQSSQTATFTRFNLMYII